MDLSHIKNLNNINDLLAYTHEQKGLLVKARHNIRHANNTILNMFGAAYTNYEIVNMTNKKWETRSDQTIVFTEQGFFGSYKIGTVHSRITGKQTTRITLDAYILVKVVDNITPLFMLLSTDKENSQ